MSLTFSLKRSGKIGQWGGFSKIEEGYSWKFSILFLGVYINV